MASVFHDNSSSNLTNSFPTVHDTELHFTKSYSSEPIQFYDPSFLPQVASPMHAFDDSDISIHDVQQSIRKPRLSSAPSPLDQIPYVIFKKCPSLHAALLSLFQECWKSCRVPDDWKIGVVKLIPKSTTVEDPRNPANYRTIALTSCVSNLVSCLLPLSNGDWSLL